MALEQEVVNVVAKTLSVGPQEVKLEGSLYASLGMDSTELVDLRVSLEKNFGVKIAAGEISKNSTVGDIAQLIESKKA